MGSLAFPSGDPEPARVAEHVFRVKARGDWPGKNAVLWDFGTVYWDHDLQKVVTIRSSKFKWDHYQGDAIVIDERGDEFLVKIGNQEIWFHRDRIEL